MNRDQKITIPLQLTIGEAYELCNFIDSGALEAALKEADDVAIAKRLFNLGHNINLQIYGAIHRATPSAALIPPSSVLSTLEQHPRPVNVIAAPDLTVVHADKKGVPA